MFCGLCSVQAITAGEGTGLRGGLGVWRPVGDNASVAKSESRTYPFSPAHTFFYTHCFPDTAAAPSHHLRLTLAAQASHRTCGLHLTCGSHRTCGRTAALAQMRQAVVGIVGATGLVGHTVLGMLQAEAGALQRHLNTAVLVVGITNSKKMAFAPQGFDSQWRDRLVRCPCS